MSSLPEVEFTLTNLVYGGDALGRDSDGRAIFVPFALPGEQVRARLVEEKTHHAQAELVKILNPAPERIEPRCSHFTVCDGCHYQHMPYASQLSAKTAILKEQLERIGGMSDIPILPAVSSPIEWFYRNHIQFHLTPQGKLGFRKPRSEEVLAIRECYLPEEALNTLWPQLEIEPLPGLERIGLRSGADGDLMLVLESRELQPPELSVEGLPLSVVHLSPDGTLVLAGSDHIFMDILDRSLRLSAGSFFQVNTPMAPRMVEHLLENLPLTGASTLLEVYCGVGLFSAFLAPRVGRLVGVESLPDACVDFIANLDEFDNVELYEDDAKRALPQLELHPDIVLVDPPRAGLERPVMDAILQMQPAALAYVSCDPATLARDARRLKVGGYSLKRITLFDLFPQTYHIESISFWER